MPILGSGNYIGLTCITLKVKNLYARTIQSPIIQLFASYFHALFIIKNEKIIGLTPFFILLIKNALCNGSSCCSSSSSSHYYCDELSFNDHIDMSDNVIDIASDIASDNMSDISMNFDNEMIQNYKYSLANVKQNNDEPVDKKILTNNIGFDMVLSNNMPINIVEKNISRGTWIITGNILIKIPPNCVWNNTNLKIIAGTNLIPNGELNYMNPSVNQSQLNSFTQSYTYNFIFILNDIQDLSIRIEGNFDKNNNFDKNMLPLLMASSNYFLTKL